MKISPRRRVEMTWILEDWFKMPSRRFIEKSLWRLVQNASSKNYRNNSARTRRNGTWRTT